MLHARASAGKITSANCDFMSSGLLDSFVVNTSYIPLLSLVDDEANAQHINAFIEFLFVNSWSKQHMSIATLNRIVSPSYLH